MGRNSLGDCLATESLRHTLCCVGSLDNSGITVKECGRHSGLNSLSANISWGCGLKSAVQGCGRRLDQSEFRPMAEVSSPVLVNPANAIEKRPLLAGNMSTRGPGRGDTYHLTDFSETWPD